MTAKRKPNHRAGKGSGVSAKALAKARGKSHVGFKAVAASAAAGGATNPGGVAYRAGVKKYGKAGMAALSATGRAKAKAKKRK